MFSLFQYSDQYQIDYCKSLYMRLPWKGDGDPPTAYLLWGFNAMYVIYSFPVCSVAGGLLGMIQSNAHWPIKVWESPGHRYKPGRTVLMYSSLWTLQVGVLWQLKKRDLGSPYLIRQYLNTLLRYLIHWFMLLVLMRYLLLLSLKPLSISEWSLMVQWLSSNNWKRT